MSEIGLHKSNGSLFNNDIELEKMKPCRLCGVNKHYSEFPKRPDTFDKLDTRCKICKEKFKRELKKVHKTAPKKPNDKICQCCRKKVKKLYLDHDHKTKSFRGWLCYECNTGIGKLGDDMDGLMMAINYLINSKEVKDKFMED